MRGRWAAALALAGLVACFERGGDDADESKEKEEKEEREERGDEPDPAGASAPEGEPDPAATIAVRLEAEPPHLNPLLGDALAARVTLGDVYQGLLTHAAPGERPGPGLAEDVEVTGGGEVWTFTLRDGVTWHDGEELTAEDVTFTLDLLRGKGKEKAPTLLAADFDDLESVEVSGREVELTFGGFRLGRREAFARLPILPAHRFGGAPAARIQTLPASREPVGTGPLRFAGWKPGVSIELERWGGYWGERAKAARVRYRILPSRQRALAELAAGRLDLAVGVPVDEALPFAEEQSDVRPFSYPRPAYLAAVYNLRHRRLREVRVRRALTMLLDRESVVEKVFRGYGEVITGPYPPGDPSEHPEVEPLPFDPDAAAALLKKPPRLTLLVPSESRTMARIADIWSADARPHAKLEVKRVPYADLLARAREGRFEVALLAFTTGPAVDLYHRFHGSQVGAENYGAVRDGELDRALEAARAEPERRQRRRHRRAVHRRLHELQPYTFIASDVRVGLARSAVGGVETGPFGPAARELWKRDPDP